MNNKDDRQVAMNCGHIFCTQCERYTIPAPFDSRRGEFHSQVCECVVGEKDYAKFRDMHTKEMKEHCILVVR